jgi:hypothetical protein
MLASQLSANLITRYVLPQPPNNCCRWLIEDRGAGPSRICQFEPCTQSSGIGEYAATKHAMKETRDEGRRR